MSRRQHGSVPEQADDEHDGDCHDDPRDCRPDPRPDVTGLTRGDLDLDP
ncbi:hypothetical protein [Micromonospora tulbaghiae]|nr:hypothetical protein [Micromonospora tulbaghiae]MDX5456984.1 hypothetical protein [Micromonospora tulbaghiae]